MINDITVVKSCLPSVHMFDDFLAYQLCTCLMIFLLTYCTQVWWFSCLPIVHMFDVILLTYCAHVWWFSCLHIVHMFDDFLAYLLSACLMIFLLTYWVHVRWFSCLPIECMFDDCLAYLLSACLMIFLHTVCWSATVGFFNQSTASHIPPSWNRLSSDLLPHNWRNSSACYHGNNINNNC